MPCIGVNHPCQFLEQRLCVGINNQRRMLNVAWHYCRVSDDNPRQYRVSIPAFYHLSTLFIDREHQDSSTLKESLGRAIPPDGVCSFYHKEYAGLNNCSGLCHDKDLGIDDGCRNIRQYKDECLSRYECGCEAVLYYTEAVVREGVDSENASFRGFLLLFEYMDGKEGIKYEEDKFIGLTADEVSPFIVLYQYTENGTTVTPHSISDSDRYAWGIELRKKIFNNNMFEYRNVMQTLNGVDKALNHLAAGYNTIKSIHDCA